MRTDLREPRFYIARGMRAYLFGERFTLKSRIVAHPNVQTGRQRLDTGKQRIACALEIVRPCTDDDFSRLDHPIRPRVERVRISAPQ